MYAALLCAGVARNHTVRQFGYFWGLAPANHLDEVGDHVTTMFVQSNWLNNPNLTVSQLAEQDIAALKQLTARNITGIIGKGLQWVFCDPVSSVRSTSPRSPELLVLRADWQARWASYWKLVSPFKGNILGFYPIDEPQPYWSGYGTITGALKAAEPTIPVIVVITARNLMDLGSTYSLPSSVDWIGFDEYGCWDSCRMDTKLAILNSYVLDRGKKMVVVPDGRAASGIPPTPAQQLTWVARNQNFTSWCIQAASCIALFPFLYNSVGHQHGLVDMPLVANALAETGRGIKNGTL